MGNTTVAGTGTCCGFGGDNGAATNALLTGPGGVAVDAAGILYIADTGNSRVRKVSNGVITTVAGTGTAGFSGDNGPATSAQLNAPYGIALDSAWQSLHRGHQQQSHSQGHERSHRHYCRRWLVRSG